MPEAYWDAASKTVKDKEFGEHLASLTTLKTEHDARLASRPEKPDGYKVELPKDFKAPEGITLKIDEKDPRVAEIRSFAHEIGLSQDQFSALVAIDAQREIARATEINAAIEAEQKKLGANASARITAVKTWLTGLLGDKRAGGLMERMVLADDIAAVEDLQRAFTTQGGSDYRGNGRDHDPPPPPTSIEQRWYGGQQKAS